MTLKASHHSLHTFALEYILEHTYFSANSIATTFLIEEKDYSIYTMPNMIKNSHIRKAARALASLSEKDLVEKWSRRTWKKTGESEEKIEDMLNSKSKREKEEAKA